VASFAEDVAAVARIDVVPRILEVVCRTTGMGFSAVARVTADHWVACAVRDDIAFGLQPGGELRLDTTICNEIRLSGQLVVIDDVEQDPIFCHHPTPHLYRFRSYISVPIILSSGAFFGTLCAIDPRPARLNTPATVEMFKLFAELIAQHLDARDRVTELELRVVHRTAALHDAHTDLQRQMEASESDREALRALAERLERVREDERTALARELHDEVGQALTALKLDLSAMRKALDGMPDSVVKRPLAFVASMDGVVESVLDGIERIVTELRPAVLDTLGCSAAAEWLASEFSRRTEIRTCFDGDPDLELPPQASTAVFRILQEALTNIARHAGASRVEVELRADTHAATLRVADDGRGLTGTDVAKAGGFGLRGMAERLRVLGGSMTLLPRAAGGTELLVRVPVSLDRPRETP
jgi:signal transduction histidine kinase